MGEIKDAGVNSFTDIRALRSQLKVCKAELDCYRSAYGPLGGETHGDTNEPPHKKMKVMEFKDNPTERYQWVNNEMLQRLKNENEDLLQTIKGGKVPMSTCDRLKEELTHLKDANERLDKVNNRLKERYKKEVRRYIEIVFKVLGFKIEFVTESRIHVKPKHSKDTYLNIDLSAQNDFRVDMKSLMKLTDQNEDNVISNLWRVWVVDRKDLSCFFSALNLELYERKKRKAMEIK